MEETSLRVGKQIYAASYDAGLSTPDTRMMTYIHAKLKEGIDLRQPCFDEKIAIKILLGSTNLLGGTNVKSLDAKFKNDQGIEYFMGGQLSNRLRLHTDEAYRERMLKVYQEKIHPVFETYDDEKIEAAFKRETDKENS